MDLLESSQFWSLTIHGFMSHPKTSFKLQQRLRGAEMEALVLIVVVTTQETVFVAVTLTSLHSLH